MIFKDRADAALQLFKLLLKDPFIKQNKKDLVVVSLLRGGIVLGAIISKKLKTPHLPLTSVKIPSPYSPELAIGALCFDSVYLDSRVIREIGLERKLIPQQINIARKKFNLYKKGLGLSIDIFSEVGGKIVLLVDDGIATGSTARAAALFLKEQKIKQICLAVPVAPKNVFSGFDKFYVLHQPKEFYSVSEFYKDFPQVENKKVKKLLTR